MSAQARLLTYFRRFCEAYQIDFIPLDDGRYLHTYKGGAWKWPLLCDLLYDRTDEEDDAGVAGGQIVFTSEVPVTVPADKSDVVSRYLHQVNWHLVHGKFEFDEANGDIRYTTSLDIADGDVTTGMICVLFDAHRLVDYHLGRLHQLLQANAGLAEAGLVFDLASRTWLRQGQLSELENQREV